MQAILLLHRKVSRVTEKHNIKHYISSAININFYVLKVCRKLLTVFFSLSSTIFGLWVCEHPVVLRKRINGLVSVCGRDSVAALLPYYCRLFCFCLYWYYIGVIVIITILFFFLFLTYLVLSNVIDVHIFGIFTYVLIRSSVHLAI